MTIEEIMHVVISMPYQKVAHQSFTDDEYVYCDKNGQLRDEAGLCLPWNEFWGLRMKSMPDHWFMTMSV